jgi:hypothetical protein
VFVSDFDTCLQLYYENQSVIKIFKNPVQHNQIKHMKIKHYFIYKKLENKNY